MAPLTSDRVVKDLECISSTLRPITLLADIKFAPRSMIVLERYFEPVFGYMWLRGAAQGHTLMILVTVGCDMLRPPGFTNRLLKHWEEEP